ncbi:MAG TPA: helix-turn-helix domain-containing protein [Thermoleophilaceae bacterium]|nr:helix-turn-helix domain-containing protein [Thermoleophilaceae bacterium]
MVSEHPWEGLPPEVAGVLRPELPGLADEIVAELSHGVPAYARPLEGPFGQALRHGVEEALGRFTTIVENPDADLDAGREVYLDLGRGEMRAGRSLDALLAAYRLGARVAWRRLAAAGESAGLPPRTLYALAEAIFAYIDELSADSIEGYAREQAAAAGALQRRRQRLAALLVQEPAAAPATVEAAAAEAAWRLPRELSALVVEAEDVAPGGGSSEQADRLALRLGPEALVAHVAPHIVAIVPAPPVRTELDAAVRGRAAALGPAVPWQEAAVSFARAREVLRLASEGGIEDGDALLMAESHKLSLLLGADRRLARDVAETALAPLAGETDLSRERLGSTLEAWLRHCGRTEAVAKALHVHPQTVRYRLTRLRELFGSRLDDPDGRFELELALRARRIAG